MGLFKNFRVKSQQQYAMINSTDYNVYDSDKLTVFDIAEGFNGRMDWYRYGSFISATLYSIGNRQDGSNVDFWVNETYDDFSFRLAQRDMEFPVENTTIKFHNVDYMVAPNGIVVNTQTNNQFNLNDVELEVFVLTDDFLTSFYRERFYLPSIAMYRKSRVKIGYFDKIVETTERYNQAKQLIDSGTVALTKKQQKIVDEELAKYESYKNGEYFYLDTYLPDVYLSHGFPKNKYGSLSTSDIDKILNTAK